MRNKLTRSLHSNVNDKDADVVDNMAPEDRGGVLAQTLNLRDIAETEMMVFPVSSYKTLLFGLNKEEEEDDNNGNVERGKGFPVAGVGANQRRNSWLLSGALVLFSIDNGKEDNNENEGANKEVYILK